MWNLFKKRWSPKQFWEWFGAQEVALAGMITDPPRLLATITPMLKRVDKNLAFEVGVQTQNNGKYDFVLSADGIRDNMPAVESLASHAPHLNRWTITKYRQRSEGVTLQFEELALTPDSILASIERQDDRIGVILYFPEAAAKGPSSQHAGFLMLDATLGELDMMTKVGSVDIVGVFANVPADAPLAKFPLRELSQRFDALWNSMQS